MTSGFGEARGGSSLCAGAPVRKSEEARITCAIVDAAARVRDLNLKYMTEGWGAPVTICDTNRASEGADKVFQLIYEKAA
jgi:hypothetical protein